MAVLYWLYDETCSVPENDGYVGVTYNMVRREKSHRKAGAFNPEFEVMVLFDGPVEECLQKEFGYRPQPNIGWNILPGGGTMGLQHPTVRKQRSQFMKDWHAKFPMPNEQRKALSKRMENNQYGLGTVFSDEEIERRRQCALENQYGIGHRKGGGMKKGHKHSGEIKATYSAARRAWCAAHPGRKDSEEAKKHKSEARKRWWEKNKDFRQSEETKAKMRASHKDRPPISELTRMRKCAARRLFELKKTLAKMKEMEARYG